MTICRNCQDRQHGPWCAAQHFGGYCACRCRVGLGLDGPFEFGDPTAPAIEDQMGWIE